MPALEERKGRAIKSDDGLVVGHAHPVPQTSLERTRWLVVLTKTGAKSWDAGLGRYSGARDAIKEFANTQGNAVLVEFNGREVSKVYPDLDRFAPVSGGLHEEAGSTPNRKRLGEMMQQWHSGQGDPIYAVGSYYYVDKPYPDQTMVERALDWFETVSGRDARDTREIKSIVSGLRYYLKHDYAGAKEMNERGLPKSGDYRNYWYFVSLKNWQDPSQGHSATLFNRRGQSVNVINGDSGDSEEEIRSAAKRHWPGAVEKQVKGRGMREAYAVADFDNLEALIEHAGGEGATHVFAGPGDTRLYFPSGERYQEAKAKMMDGYWHIPAPHYRPVVNLPPGAEPIENFGFYQQKGRRREGAALRKSGASRRGAVREVGRGAGSGFGIYAPVSGHMMSVDCSNETGGEAAFPVFATKAEAETFIADHDVLRGILGVVALPSFTRSGTFYRHRSREMSEARPHQGPFERAPDDRRRRALGGPPGPGRGHNPERGLLIGQWVVVGKTANGVDYGEVVEDNRSRSGGIDVAWQWSGTVTTVKRTSPDEMAFYSSENDAKREAEARVQTMSPGPSYSNRFTSEARRKLPVRAPFVPDADEAIFTDPASIERFIEREIAKHGDVARDNFRYAADDAAKLAKKYEDDVRAQDRAYPGAGAGKEAAATAAQIRKSEALLRKAAKGHGVSEAPKKKPAKKKRSRR